MGAIANNTVSTKFHGHLGSSGAGAANIAKPTWVSFCTCPIPTSGDVQITSDCVLNTQIVVTGSLNVTGVPDAIASNGDIPNPS